MTIVKEELPSYMKEDSKIGNEISITGKWVPTKKGGMFRKSKESIEMVKEWDDIHDAAKGHEGVLSTEINHAIGQEAVLVHHVFENTSSLVGYFKKVAEDHVGALSSVAKPDTHLIRGIKMNDEIIEELSAKNVKGSFGEYLFGYVKNGSKRPNPETSIQVTAKWKCKDGGTLEELIYWWQKVGTEAFTLENGLVRFEVYQVLGEDALIIHETFDTNEELKYHLSKGTAEKYKKDIDKVAEPEDYFFRGPVSWMIRTYSKFLHLPATYTSQGKVFMQDGGNMSDGIF
ncbi:MAG: hypothetical protein ACI8ZM_004740 [Crocinitomix sp.]|jgi:hypothetical protein